MFTRRNFDSWPECLVRAMIDGVLDGWTIEVLTSEASVMVVATQGTFSVTAMCGTFEQAARSAIMMVQVANEIDENTGVGRA